MVIVLAHITTTACALKHVVFAVNITSTKSQLQVPMATENEVVAIGNTGTDTDALITMIGQLREIGSKKRKIILNTAKIELSSVSVNTEEMTRETSFLKRI